MSKEGRVHRNCKISINFLMLFVAYVTAKSGDWSTEVLSNHEQSEITSLLVGKSTFCFTQCNKNA